MHIQHRAGHVLRTLGTVRAVESLSLRNFEGLPHGQQHRLYHLFLLPGVHQSTRRNKWPNFAPGAESLLVILCLIIGFSSLRCCGSSTFCGHALTAGGSHRSFDPWEQFFLSIEALRSPKFVKPRTGARSIILFFFWLNQFYIWKILKLILLLYAQSF